MGLRGRSETELRAQVFSILLSSLQCLHLPPPRRREGDGQEPGYRAWRIYGQTGCASGSEMVMEGESRTKAAVRIPWTVASKTAFHRQSLERAWEQGSASGMRPVRASEDKREGRGRLVKWREEGERERERERERQRDRLFSSADSPGPAMLRMTMQDDARRAGASQPVSLILTGPGGEAASLPKQELAGLQMILGASQSWVIMETSRTFSLSLAALTPPPLSGTKVPSHES